MNFAAKLMYFELKMMDFGRSTEPEPEPEPEQAVRDQEDQGYWKYQMYDGEWEFVPPGGGSAAEAPKPNFIDIENLLEQSTLAESRKAGLRKLDDLTREYKAVLVQLIMDDEAMKMDNQDYLVIKRREINLLGLTQVRDEMVDRGLDAESVTWLRGNIGELIPNLIELLKDLEEDSERLAALGTIKQIVRELALDRSFLQRLPQLTAAIFFLKCGQDGLVFSAADECLDEIVSCSTHRRLVDIAEEAVGVTNEDRLRDRAMNCVLQIMLTWPAAKLQRQQAQLQVSHLLIYQSPAWSTDPLTILTAAADPPRSDDISADHNPAHAEDCS